MYRVLDLFSGIGGFSLGLERTGGFRTVAFCEIDPFCRKVLAKHWPDVPCYDDIRTLTAETLSRDGIAVDVICGGFPCQDVSHAGKRAGLEAARSGLWSEYARLIGELRPRYAIVENVPGLLSLGMGDVLGDLAALGFDAVWDCIPASALGAPHLRDRVWLIAQPQHPHADHAGSHRAQMHVNGGAELRHQQEREPGSLREDVSNPNRESEYDGAVDAEMARVSQHSDTAPLFGPEIVGSEPDGDSARAGDVAHANGAGLEGRRRESVRERAGEWTARTSSPSVADAASSGREGPENTGGSGEGSGAHQWSRSPGGGWWLSEPNVGRVAHGVPARVDRLRSLGNAVVPQIPELIGRAILAAERAA